MKKKFLIFIFIIFIIFLCFYYIFVSNGNNKFKKSNEEIIENILNDKYSYTAEAKVTICSNKNQNEYTVKQEENEVHSYQEVMSGDLQGLTIEYKDNKLIVKNAKLNLEKIYQEHREFTNSYLFLKTFIKEYIESDSPKDYEEDEKNFIIEIELKNPTKYIKYKKLYIDKSLEAPSKLIIKNSAKQEVSSIEYINVVNQK